MCGETKTETISATGHTFSEDWSFDDTHHWHAATCEHSDQVSDKAEHTWDAGVETIPATCTEEGVITYTCTVCGETKTETSPASHTFSEDWSFDDTHHWHAATCGHSDQVSDKAEHTWDAGVETTPATCTEDGVKTYTCTVCGETKTETISATGHTFSEDWTCDGTYHWHQCSCGQVEDKAEHTWDAGVETTPATCTEEGVITYTCNVCGETKTETIPATGHNFSEDWSCDDTYHWHAATCEHSDQVSDKAEHTWDAGVETTPATCTEVGIKTYTCTVCGETKTETIPATDHTFSEEWTCDGTYHWHQCSCGQVSGKAEHNLVNGTCPICNYATLDYSLSEDGTYYIVTGPGGNTGNITIPATYNNLPVKEIGNGAFSGCSGLTSVTIGSGVTSIGEWAFNNCSNLTSVTIGSGVTTIGNYAFYGCSGLTSVTIGSGVTSIGDYAFQWCSGLTSVTIGSGVTSIGMSAFYGCSGLTSVTIGSGVTSIGYEAFRGCSSLTNITIPDSVTSIDNYAFFDCSGLTSITIPDSVTTIGNYAFYGCSGLTSVTIGNSVTSIGDGAFGSCYKLIEVYNKSALSLTIGDQNNGDVAYYAKNIYTQVEGKSWLTDTKDGYSFFYDGNNNVGYLLAYLGTQTTLLLPQSFTAYNGTLVEKYEIYQYAFYSKNSLTSVTIPDSVTGIGDEAFYNCSGLISVTIGNGVTSIGERAFQWCSGLTGITIPDSVTSIGYEAFSGCSGLTSVTIGSGVTSIGDYAFQWCSGLTSITIPDSVTSIGHQAFYGCSSLTSVTIGSGVTSIGSGAFYNCTALTQINYNAAEAAGLTSISDVFYNAGTKSSGITVVFGESVKSIPAYLFYVNKSSYRPNITSVTIGSGVISIGESAFSGCTGLTEIVIPDSVTSIGNYAFMNCSGLTSLTIGSGLTSIGMSAFSDCSTNLTNIIVSESNTVYHSANNCLIETAAKILILGCKSSIIPDDGSIAIIGGSAFSGCSGLTSVTIPDSVTSIGSSAFSGCSGLTSVSIPSGVKTIHDYAFSRCSGLTSITIPDSVTSIGYGAFSGCSGLTSVTIPDSVTSIEGYVFRDCSGLTSVTIPNSVTSIGYEAFRGCSGLTSVTIGSGVTSIDYWAFYGCNSLTSVTFANPNGWWYSSYSSATSGTSISSADLANASTAATYLTSTYNDYYWKRTA